MEFAKTRDEDVKELRQECLAVGETAAACFYFQIKANVSTLCLAAVHVEPD